MTDAWYYTHGGQVYGPVSAEEVRKRAADGLLRPDDLLWPEELGRGGAVAAGATLNFPALPDWLGDVERPQPRGPLPPAPVDPALPDWLADVALADGSRGRGPGTAADTGAESGRAAPTAIPEWLEDLRRTESLPPAEPSQSPAPAPPAGEPAIVGVQAGSPVPTESAPAAQGGQAVGDHRPGERVPEEEPGKPAQTAAESLDEAFQRGRWDVARWLDRDKTLPLLLAGDLEVIRQDAGLRQVLQPYEGYGRLVMDRLWHHVEFMVENRRRYYAARG